MGKILSVAITLACMLLIGTKATQAQSQTVSLDEAIRNAVVELSDGMERNTGIAIVSMEAGSDIMSSHLGRVPRATAFTFRREHRTCNPDSPRR